MAEGRVSNIVCGDCAAAPGGCSKGCPVEPVKEELVEEPPIEEPPKDEVRLNTTWTLYALASPVVVGLGPGAAAAAAAAAGADFNPTMVKTIGSMEAFWSLFHASPAPSTRVPSFTYYFFRKTINPSWEDPRNKRGGRFAVVVWDRDKPGVSDKAAVDDVWQLTMALLAGDC